jgi:hypothetical protein
VAPARLVLMEPLARLAPKATLVLSALMEPPERLVQLVR